MYGQHLVLRSASRSHSIAATATDTFLQPRYHASLCPGSFTRVYKPAACSGCFGDCRGPWEHLRNAEGERGFDSRLGNPLFGRSGPPGQRVCPRHKSQRETLENSRPQRYERDQLLPTLSNTVDSRNTLTSSVLTRTLMETKRRMLDSQARVEHPSPQAHFLPRSGYINCTVRNRQIALVLPPSWTLMSTELDIFDFL